VVFQFTGHSQEALNFVTINRAVLHPIPVLYFTCSCKSMGTFLKGGTLPMAAQLIVSAFPCARG